MALPVRSRRRCRQRRHEVHRPAGTLHPRVEAVGPQHFGVVSVDCAKARSKWMLADFYGNVLIEPVEVPHTGPGFRAALARLRQAVADHHLDDLIVAVERTGRDHLPVKCAFADAGFEVRTVHPFATKQFRLPADPGNKTDETDLSAIHRAAVNGFGLTERRLDDLSLRLRSLARYRRDLVRKGSALKNQIQEHLELLMPGYAACFDDVFISNIALLVARRTGSPEAVRHLGKAGLERLPDFRARIRAEPSVPAWRSLPWLCPSDPGAAVGNATMRCTSPQGRCTRASSRSDPSTSASSASTAPRPGPSGCSPTSSAVS